MTEGHNLDAQTMLREQRFNTKSVNLVQEAVDLLGTLVSSESALRVMRTESMRATCALLKFLVEAVQGPCAENQVLVAEGAALDVCRCILDGAKLKEDKDGHWGQTMKCDAVKLIAGTLESRVDFIVHDYLIEKLQPRRTVSIQTTTLAPQAQP